LTILKDRFWRVHKVARRAHWLCHIDLFDVFVVHGLNNALVISLYDLCITLFFFSSVGGFLRTWVPFLLPLSTVVLIYLLL